MALSLASVAAAGSTALAARWSTHAANARHRRRQRGALRIERRQHRRPRGAGGPTQFDRHLQVSCGKQQPCRRHVAGQQHHQPPFRPVLDEQSRQPIGELDAQAIGGADARELQP
jgi:hypothetical protein